MRLQNFLRKRKKILCYWNACSMIYEVYDCIRLSNDIILGNEVYIVYDVLILWQIKRMVQNEIVQKIEQGRIKAVAGAVEQGI